MAIGIVNYGTNGNDSLNGTADDDYIDGGLGNDVINGGVGNDTLRGNYGNDTLDGGAGNDTAILFGNRSDYAIVYDPATQEFEVTDLRTNAPSGRDVFKNIESLRFTDGTIATASLIATPSIFTVNNDTYYGTTANETLSGLGGNDYIDGGYGNDVINGDAGDDSLRGNYGNDSIDGGIGNDRAIYTGNRADYTISYNASTQKLTITDRRNLTPSGTDTLSNIETLQFADGLVATASLITTQFTSGNDTYYGNSTNELLDGLAGNDYLDGGYGNDTIYGGAGNDTLRGNYGNDVVDGGTGTDTAILFGTRANYSVVYDPATQIFTLTDLRQNAPSGVDTYVNVENFQFSDGTVAAATLIGTQTFSEGNDTYYGALGNENLNGLGGNDYIDGNYGHDTIQGGAGNDTLRGNYGDDSLDGGTGSDLAVYAGNRWDYAIWYNAGTQTFTIKDLRFNATIGTDTVKNIERFQFADGILTAAEVNATPLFTNGNDTWYGSSLADNVSGLGGNDGLDGGAGNDKIDGAAGNDYLTGAAGDDTLLGGAENDSLTGGAGNDVLDGGAGVDKAFFAGYRANYDITYDPTTGHYTFKQKYTGTLTDIDDVVNVEHFQFADGPYTAATLNATIVNGGFVFTQGADNWAGTPGNDSVFALGGNDTLKGNNGNDYINGGAGNDVILGDLGNDLLQGGDGDDFLFGGIGNDTLDGVAGEDKAYFNGNASDFTVTFDAARNQFFVKDNRAGLNQGTDLVTQVEQFSFNGQIYDVANFVTGAPVNGFAVVDLSNTPFHF